MAVVMRMGTDQVHEGQAVRFVSRMADSGTGSTLGTLEVMEATPDRAIVQISASLDRDEVLLLARHLESTARMMKGNRP